MSRYGDSESGIRKESMYDELYEYIEDNGLGNLLEIIADIVNDEEAYKNGKSNI